MKGAKLPEKLRQDNTFCKKDKENKDIASDLLSEYCHTDLN